jgi:hypothetical protein
MSVVRRRAEKRSAFRHCVAALVSSQADAHSREHGQYRKHWRKALRFSALHLAVEAKAAFSLDHLAGAL